MESEIVYGKEDVKEMPEVCEAIITSIEKKTAEEVYGSDCKFKEKIVFKVSYENTEWKLKSHEIFAFYEKEFVPDKSKLGKFIMKFGEFKVGTKFKLMRKDDGFYKVYII